MKSNVGKAVYIGPLALLMAIAGVALMLILAPEPDMYREDGVPSASREVITVEMQLIERNLYRSSIDVQGFVTSRWSGALKADVAGKVIEVSDSLLEGSAFRKGDTLLRIDDTRYQAALAQAVASVASARQALITEQQRADRALEDWNRIGFAGEPDALALRKPQLRVAEARLTAAKLNLKTAQLNLDNTIIKAPYDGAVKKRNISLGGLVESGAELATIYSTQALQVAFKLSQREMALLAFATNPPEPREVGVDKSLSDNTVMIRSIQRNQQWAASITRVSQDVSLQQRKQTVFADVIPQADMPLSGEFVEARLTGINKPNLFKLPESGVSKNGRVWYANDESELQSFSAETVFVDNGYVYVEAPQRLSQIQLVLSPLSHFYEGMKVQVTPNNKAALKQESEETQLLSQVQAPVEPVFTRAAKLEKSWAASPVVF